MRDLSALRKCFIIIFISLAGCTVPSPPATSAVGTLIRVEGACELPAAIIAANRDEVYGGCTAGTGADTLELSADVLITEPLDFTEGVNALPAITSTLTINGNGFTVALAPNVESGRLFLVLHDPQAGFFGDLTLNNIVLRGANGRQRGGIDGGAVANLGGRLTLTDSLITENRGGSLYDVAGIWAWGGETVITNSVFRANEGYALAMRDEAQVSLTGTLITENVEGIYLFQGRLDIAESGFTDNRVNPYSGWGGSVIRIDQGEVNIRDSSFYRNEAPILNRGGILNIRTSTFADNSGVTLKNGERATLENVTLSTSGLSAIENEGELRLVGVTVVYNNQDQAPQGAGLVNAEGQVTLINSIVAFNAGADCYAVSAYSAFTGQRNRDSDSTCPDSAPLEGLSTSLEMNGGLTRTYALLAGSNAIDAGLVADCPATDQRGFGRLNACDIGAFEWEGVAP